MSNESNKHISDEQSGWVEIKDHNGIFGYHFQCTKCGGHHPEGYPVAPDYCAYCGHRKLR